MCVCVYTVKPHKLNHPETIEGIISLNGDK